VATSQNGYPANDRSLVSSRQIPGSQVKVTVRNGAAGDLLLYAAGRWDKEVEDIDNARGALDDWGYAERPIRGGSTLSNHASGTAIDLNATQHPLSAVGTFDSDQVKAIRRILADCGGAVRWGGDYLRRKDEMHLEIVASEKRCAQVLLRLVAAPPTDPAPPSSGTYCKVGDRNDRVLELQQFLTKFAPSYNAYRPTGFYGIATTEGVREFQRRVGITGPDADGKTVGPRTLAKLREVGFRP